MERQAAVKLIRDTFESSFDKGRFINLSKNLFKYLDGSKNFTYQGNIIPDAYEKSVQSLERVGKYQDADDNKIDVLIVRLKKEHSLERARTMQRNFVAWYLNGSRGGELKDAALVAFVSPESTDWRFSLVRMDYNLVESPSRKVKVEKELTPARRYSFLVGENESSHTAQVQLLPILENDTRNPLLSDFEKAFSIEVVTREFFTKYRNLFHEVEEALQKLVRQNEKIRGDFKAKSVDTVNFAKKLLGQVVFLYFLQKKGWFGVGRDEDWGTGPKDFLRRLFEKKVVPYGNFFNDVLEPLFYEALAVERTDDFYSRFNCKIPFLNGGLFDPINNYDWVHTDILLPNKLFSNTDKTKEGDTGTGILDVFDRYNFTVKEDEPLDKEVAVDPEMLGKVFENLLEVKDRKSKGTYYTPREIVHYMCQESLINYLDTALNIGDVPLVTEKPVNLKLFGTPATQQRALTTPGYTNRVPREDIETFVRMGELAIEHDARVESTGRETRDYSYKLPQSIRLNAKLIDDKLASIRVCDPAIGSGAFPVGLMTEIVRARNTLTTYLPDKKGRTNYHFKRHAIQNCLYGVDIDPGAVEIAKLRLWLSLVVDEEDIKQIQPLPNLDYKIVCGNSLLGVERNLFNVELFNELERLKPIYFNETNAKKKQEYKKQIDQLINKITNDNETFDFEVYFSEVFHEKGGFDVVIANPPYFNIEVSDSLTKACLKASSEIYCGKADICYFFFETGINILNYSGTLTFITSRYYIEATYASSLRDFITKNSSVLKLVDFFNCSIFEYASIHNIITILSKQRQNSETEVAVFSEFSVNSLVAPNNFRTFKAVLNTGDWLLAGATELNVFRKIGTNCTTLGNLATIEQGQKSGLNSVFCVGEELANGFEKEPLRKMIKNSHIGKYYIDYKKLYLIYADDSFDISKCPIIRQYLLRHKDKLKARAEAKDGLYPWYRLQRPRDEKLFSVDEKIVVPYRAPCNRFAYDNQQYFNDGGDIRIIVLKPNCNVSTKYCLSILNSKLMEFYYSFIGRRKGDVYEYFVEPLSKIPIKKVDREKQKPCISLVDQILAITKDEDYLSNPAKQAKVKELERQIDQMVYELYGLTPEEIAVVEGYNRR
jgi:type I restriction-modification system DNA methylase subunit